MDSLFSNPGNRIKNAAKALFVIEAVFSFLSGLLVIFEEEEFLLGLIVIATGVAVSFISALLLYAFGELVESSQENREINRRILMALNNGAAQTPVASTPAVNAVPAAPAGYKASAEAAPAAPQPVSSGSNISGIWYCRSCGKPTSNAYSTCFHCGKAKE